MIAVRVTFVVGFVQGVEKGESTWTSNPKDIPTTYEQSLHNSQILAFGSFVGFQAFLISKLQQTSYWLSGGKLRSQA